MYIAYLCCEELRRYLNKKIEKASFYLVIWRTLLSIIALWRRNGEVNRSLAKNCGKWRSRSLFGEKWRRHGEVNRSLEKKWRRNSEVNRSRKNVEVNRS